jgi:hypothetical protein
VLYKTNALVTHTRMCVLSPAAAGGLTITGIVLLVLVLVLGIVLLVAFLKTAKSVNKKASDLKKQITGGEFAKQVVLNVLAGVTDAATSIASARVANGST